MPAYCSGERLGRKHGNHHEDPEDVDRRRREERQYHAQREVAAAVLALAPQGETAAVEYGYVDNPTGDGMVTRFANGIKMILSCGKTWWRGSS